MKTEQTGHGTLETWTPDEVARALADGKIAMIDVRTPAEYMQEQIEGALLAPMAYIVPERLPLGGDRPVVLYCGGSRRSEAVARQILESGVVDRIAHLEGGFGAWKEAGKPYRGTDLATGAPKLVR
ncbi:rhodanese-like domain-containing protein [Paracoccus hibiscisoli]|uniref:Rhodanese-like domain-containing protein n=1 Tax=Paracoccus hibiscisoli TaxID=2023261 RepID=A0A4U0QSF9_9RHOB|nr:rhodanese-like domain-containing protein [Paracoccus hibiscisoli]TJZ84915.1 rhodanese-like domain-containing protein [Paracoccus hibiscisoli]